MKFISGEAGVTKVRDLGKKITLKSHNQDIANVIFNGNFFILYPVFEGMPIDHFEIWVYCDTGIGEIYRYA